jgi:hypothetical protein
MPRVQAAFTIEMRGVRGVGITTTASTTITNAIHGVMQQQQQQVVAAVLGIVQCSLLMSA